MIQIQQAENGFVIKAETILRGEARLLIAADFQALIQQLFFLTIGTPDDLDQSTLDAAIKLFEDMRDPRNCTEACNDEDEDDD